VDPDPDVGLSRGQPSYCAGALTPRAYAARFTITRIGSFGNNKVQIPSGTLTPFCGGEGCDLAECQVALKPVCSVTGRQFQGREADQLRECLPRRCDIRTHHVAYPRQTVFEYAAHAASVEFRDHREVFRLCEASPRGFGASGRRATAAKPKNLAAVRSFLLRRIWIRRSHHLGFLSQFGTNAA
jgi:hypothetical protein